VEKYALELAETKDKYEESETLLGEAISAQISTEKKMEKEVAVCREELEKG
jgi:phage shock protein A